MADFLQGFLGTAQAGVEARNDVTVAVRNWFANRNPLVTRLPYVPVERVDFLMFTHRYRARCTTLGGAITSTGQATLTVADATFLMNHDVLEVVDSATGNVERRPDRGRPVDLVHGQCDTRLVVGHQRDHWDHASVVGREWFNGEPDRQ